MKEQVTEFKRNKQLQIYIITLSDRASAGDYDDKSGPTLKDLVDKFFTERKWKYKTRLQLIPDEPDQLRTLLNKVKTEEFDILFTTGGTGVGTRDITVDVVKTVLDKEIPGIMEMIRHKFGSEKPNALLSRSVAGVMGQTIVYTLPGSVGAVKDYMSEISKTLEHLLYMVNNIDTH